MTALSVLWGYINMFIRRFRYISMLELIAEQKKVIATYQAYLEKVKQENKQLRTDKVILQNMLRDNNPYNIDFPNSMKGGFEDSDIFTL